MEDIDLKNMVVLKDLPSNIVKEAYVVFKSNRMTKKVKKANKNSKTQISINNKDNQYAIKEAEMLVSEYIERIEKSEKEVILNSRKNKKLRKYVYISSAIIILQFILLIIK